MADNSFALRTYFHRAKSMFSYSVLAFAGLFFANMEDTGILCTKCRYKLRDILEIPRKNRSFPVVIILKMLYNNLVIGI